MLVVWLTDSPDFDTYASEFLDMSLLADAAFKGLSDFRRKVSAEPLRFEEHAKDFQSILENCADRNRHEGGIIRNLGLSQKNFESLGFPPEIKFQEKEYLIAEYLLLASRRTRKSLVQMWRDGLQKKALEFYKNHGSWERSYSKISRFSFEYLDLKSASTIQRLDRKTLYAIRQVRGNSLVVGELTNEDWQYPVNFANDIDSEFRRSNKELLIMFGIDHDAASHYYRIAEITYKQERALKYAAVAGGAALAAYGIGSLMANAGGSIGARAAMEATRLTKDMNLGAALLPSKIPNYGFFSRPEFLVLPHNQLAANQLGFQSYSQGILEVSSLALSAGIGALTASHNYGSETPPVVSKIPTLESGSEKSAGISMGDVAGILGIALAANSRERASGNMLGSATQLLVSDHGGSSLLSGSINGKPISRLITRLGSNGIMIS